MSAHASLRLPAARPLPGSPGPCPVCGCPEVHTDEVEVRGVVFLAECSRCRQRWTSRLPEAPGVVSVRAPLRVHRGAASAA